MTSDPYKIHNLVNNRNVNSNTGWITDRLPTEKDTVNILGYARQVFVFDRTSVTLRHYTDVELGTPWQPIYVPAPYVKPKENNNMNTKWITDRRPTREDGNYCHKVWVTYRNGEVDQEHWAAVKPPMPWQRIIDKPEPYIKPKRWTVEWDDIMACWKLQSFIANRRKIAALLSCLSARDEHAEAAQRIADIYNEVLP